MQNVEFLFAQIVSVLVVGLPGHDKLTELSTVGELLAALPRILDVFCRLARHVQLILVCDKTSDVLLHALFKAREAHVAAGQLNVTVERTLYILEI